MNPQWKVRKTIGPGRQAYEPVGCKCLRGQHMHVWSVYEPDGSWSADCETWDEAMAWATSFAERVEYWSLTARTDQGNGLPFYQHLVDTLDAYITARTLRLPDEDEQ